MGFSLRRSLLSPAAKRKLRLHEYMQGVTYIHYGGNTYFLTPNDKYILEDALSRSYLSKEEDTLCLELRQPTGAGTGQMFKFDIETIIACLEEMYNRKEQNHR